MWDAAQPVAVTFVESTGFTKRIVRLGLEESLRELQLHLAANPTAGRRNPGTGGLRKARMVDEAETLTADKLFAELLEAAHEALEHARGKRELRTTVLPPSPPPMNAVEVKRLRVRLKASQAVFAHYLNVSAKLVQAWESARRRPNGPALLLLRLIEQDPAVLFASHSAAQSAKGGRAAERNQRASKNGRSRDAERIGAR